MPSAPNRVGVLNEHTSLHCDDLFVVFVQTTWQLGSSVFGLILRKYAPSDTYQVSSCKQAQSVCNQIHAMHIHELRLSHIGPM